jgi:hypothetical protein
MPEPGRNDPCPCGSGKKYKRCCMARREEESRQGRDQVAGLGRAIGWLFDHHGPAVEDAILEFFDRGRGEVASFFADLPAGLKEMAEINLNEWLLADAEIVVDGARRRTAELVLEAGPPLEAAARSRVAELARPPLRLYEVEECRPGEGLFLRDALEPGAAPAWVKERTASRTLIRHAVFGARIILEGGERELSGAIYPIPRGDLLRLKDFIRGRLRGRRATDLAVVRRVVGLAIIDAWVSSISPKPLPRIQDAASGDPLLLVTDHYRVRDWDRLAAALEREGRIRGSREDGWVLLESEPTDEPGQRFVLSLTPGSGDRLEAFARTRRLAEEGKSWLAGVAGDLLIFVTREIVDPVGALRHGVPRKPKPRADSAKDRDMPPAERTELLRQVFEHQYSHWADEPIPALGGKTPRQSLRSKRGRERVVDLLRLYEHEEEKNAKEEGREPVRFDFLWEALRLDRERPFAARAKDGDQRDLFQP